MEIFKCDACDKITKKEDNTEIEIKEKGGWLADKRLHFCVNCITMVKSWIDSFCGFDFKDKSKPAEVVDENKILDKENKKASDVNDTQGF